MAERYIYEPAEIADAADYVEQKTTQLLKTHAANWRRIFTSFVDEMSQRFEGLRLLLTLLNGNRNVDTGKWFDEAVAGSPPPLPDKPYDAMALVWQQISAAVKRHGEGFFVTKSSIDFPYVLSCAFQGGSLGEKFHRWGQRYRDPFVTMLRGWLERITARMPKAAKFDLWDLALEVVNEAEVPPATTDEDEEPPAAKPKPDAKPKPAAKAADATPADAKKGKKKKKRAGRKGTKKGRPVTSAKKGGGKKRKSAKKG